MPLTPERRKQLDDIVLKMAGQNAPQKDVQLIVNDFIQKFGNESPLVQEKKSFENPVNEVSANLGIGVLKGAGSTLHGLGSLASKALIPMTNIIGKGVNAITGKKTYTPITSQVREQIYAPPRALETQGIAQNIGKGAEQIVEFLIPAGKVTKATKAMSFLPRILTRATGDAAITFAQLGGNIKQSGETGVLSAGLQTISPILGYGAKILGSTVKGLAGGLSSRGTDVIEQLLKTPDEGLAGLRGDIVQGLKKDALAIREYIEKMRSGSTANYQQALESLPKRMGAIPKVLVPGIKTTIKQGGEKIILTMQGIKSAYTSLLRTHGVELNPRKKILDFLETQLSRSEEGILRNVFEDINKWKNTTPVGIDKLASKINAYKKTGETSPELNGILGSLSKATRNYIGQRVPAAKAMVDRYIDEQTFLNELQTYLGNVGFSKDPIGIKTTIGKLQTLFTKNKEMAREVLTKIPGGEEILGRQAGRELATQVPRSISAIGSILQGVVNAVIPPRVIGEIVAYSGMGMEKAKPLVEALQKVSPAIRVMILKAVLGVSDGDNQK